MFISTKNRWTSKLFYLTLWSRSKTKFCVLTKTLIFDISNLISVLYKHYPTYKKKFITNTKHGNSKTFLFIVYIHTNWEGVHTRSKCILCFLEHYWAFESLLGLIAVAKQQSTLQMYVVLPFSFTIYAWFIWIIKLTHVVFIGVEDHAEFRSIFGSRIIDGLLISFEFLKRSTSKISYILWHFHWRGNI